MAAPTTTNSVTVRKLSSVITGLWTKIKNTFAAKSHTHGNIQNGGTLQTSDVAIANGDKLVVTDASDSSKVARTSLAFDGSTTFNFLSKKGTFEPVKESEVDWGGSFHTYLSPIEWGNMFRNLVANPLPSAIKFEKTTNGGSTWVEQTVTDAGKLGLFNLYGGAGDTFLLPNTAYSGLSDSTLLRGRITLTALTDFSVTSLATNTWCYGDIKRIFIFCSRSGTASCKIELQTGPHFIAKDDVWETLDTIPIAGDSGWNSIPIDTVFGGYNGQLTSRYVAIRFTYWTNTTIANARINIMKIGILPSTYWISRAPEIAIGGFPVSVYNNGTGLIEVSRKLATTRELAVNLANTSITSNFDGSADQTGIKVSGKLADANIASASTWNAKQDALTEITDQEVTDLLNSLT